MKLLAIDTTKPIAHIIVADDDNFFVSEIDRKEKVSENLLPTIDEVLFKNNLSLEDFDVFGAVVGPGSFTGIRVGLSTIKAFSAVFNKKKLVAVNSFEPFLQVTKNGWVLLNCTKNSFYYTKIKNGKIVKHGVFSSVEVFQNIDKTEFVYTLAMEQISVLSAYINLVAIDNYHEILYRSIHEKIKNGKFIKNKKLLPFYVQLSQAERNLKK